MTFQSRVFAAMAVALVAGAAVYLAGAGEPVGTILLVGCAAFAVWAGFYLRRLARVEDRFDHPESGEALGTFPDATRWAPVLALGLVLTINGLIVGTWLLLSGGFLTVVAVLGYTFEYGRRREGPTPETG